MKTTKILASLTVKYTNELGVPIKQYFYLVDYGTKISVNIKKYFLLDSDNENVDFFSKDVHVEKVYKNKILFRTNFEIQLPILITAIHKLLKNINLKDLKL